MSLISLIFLIFLNFSFSAITFSLSGNELTYETNSTVAGVQFNHDACIDDVGGGDANGWFWSVSGDTVFGFDASGQGISGSGTFVILTGSPSENCISNFSVSDISGESICTYWYDDCYNCGVDCNDNEYYGCTDPTCENYDSDATIDDGSCINCVEAFCGDGDCNSEEDIYNCIDDCFQGSDDIFFNRISFYDNVSPNSDNQNNFLNRGMPIRFKVRVQSYETDDLLMASAHIFTNNEYVTITDSFSNYNNILEGDSKWGTDEFEIQIDSNIPIGSSIKFLLEIQNELDPGVFWYSVFDFPIEPTYVDIIWIDDDPNPDSDGNDNDIIEPGETIEVLPGIGNLSTSMLYDVEGTLFSSYADIVIWNSGSDWVDEGDDTYLYGDGLIYGGQLQNYPELDYVFDYNMDFIYEFDLDLILEGCLNDECGWSWDNGGSIIKWKNTMILNEGQTELSNSLIPNSFNLLNIYPNPFNPSTNISYDISKLSNVKISIYNANGQLVEVLENKLHQPGEYNITLNADDYTSGVYFIKLISDNFIDTQKIMLIK